MLDHVLQTALALVKTPEAWPGFLFLIVAGLLYVTVKRTRRAVMRDLHICTQGRRLDHMNMLELASIVSALLALGEATTGGRRGNAQFDVLRTDARNLIAKMRDQVEQEKKEPMPAEELP